MDRLLDARGLACPLPVLEARAALRELGPGDALTVLATDPEAPLDIGALAADGGHAFSVEPDDGPGWRMRIVKRNLGSGAGPLASVGERVDAHEHPH